MGTYMLDEFAENLPDAPIATLDDLRIVWGADHLCDLPHAVYSNTDCGAYITLLFADGWKLHCDTRDVGERWVDNKCETNPEISWNLPHKVTPSHFVIGSIVEGSDAEDERSFEFGCTTAAKLKEWLVELEAWAAMEWESVNSGEYAVTYAYEEGVDDGDDLGDC